mmetsp:Transcript_82269/g.158932  ORF Transcript_82269/g.158932 Transcript_82269/m.158932 type:complete len:677 (+) Transcript_82269:95-2125(+)
MALSERLLPATLDGPELDALIVGGGPVGILIASEMASRGCKVRLIDINHEPVIMTKASGVAERSMEILPQAVSDSIMKTSQHVQRARLNEHDGSGNARTIGTIGMETGKRGGKGMRSQMQWLTEKALRDYMESLPDRCQAGQNLKISRPYELLRFEEIDGGIRSELKNHSTGATEQVQSKFLVGCDGGRSTVRKGLGFTFHGETTAEYFFAIHATFTGYMGDDTSMDMYFSKGDDPMAWGFIFAMPMPDGGYLILCDLDPTQQGQWATGEFDRNGYNVMHKPEVEDVLRILKSRGCGQDLGIVPGTVQWLAHFRVNSRQTNHYGKGRVYLAGDACHCHSPLGGQGMNMGFNDAKNIAWKLAYAAKGTVPLSFLDTYEKERQPIEHKILLAIERGQKAVSSRNPVIFFMRGRGQRVAPIILNFAMEHTDGELLRYGTQQAWTYATSPLAVEHWERPSVCPPLPNIWHRKNQNIFRWISTRIRAGDTVPDAPVGDTSIERVLKRSRGWVLLLFQGSASDNEILSKYVRNVKIYSKEELQSLGDSMKATADSTGFVAGIDEVLVVPADSQAHNEFHVRAQCLYLIRPDFHVALRSEPIREGMVWKYFDQQCGMEVAPYSAPRSAPLFDALPVTVHGVIVTMALAYCLSSGFDTTWICVVLAVSSFALCFIIRASRPPKD